MIYNFDDFLLEKATVILFQLTDELESALQTISVKNDNAIIKRLLKDNNYLDSVYKPITLIDMALPSTNKWSFVNAGKVLQTFDEENPEFISSYEIKNSNKVASHKSETTIGRIINKLYPNEYKPTDIEVVVNLYKQHLMTNFDNIDVVSGKDINHWYDSKNYKRDDFLGRSTELHNSCMGYADKNHFMDLYSLNPEKVEMVILYDEEDKTKICARALLWSPDEVGDKPYNNKIMDRVYYNKEDDKNLLTRYAQFKGWDYIAHKLFNEYYYISNKKVDYISIKMFDMKIPDHKKFPYADTMRYFKPYGGVLSNSLFDNSMGTLQSQQGRISGIDI